MGTVPSVLICLTITNESPLLQLMSVKERPENVRTINDQQCVKKSKLKVFVKRPEHIEALQFTINN